MFELLACGYRATYTGGLEISRESGAPYYVFVYYRTPCVYEAAEGDVPARHHYVLLEPSVAHRYRSQSAPYIDDWAHFRADVDGRKLIADLGIRPNRPVLCEHYPRMEGILQSLQNIKNRPQQWQQSLASALITSLLTGLAASPQAGEERATHKYYPMFSEIRTRLHQMPEEKHTIEALAAGAGLSLSRFQHLYKEILGQTPGEDIALARLERAKYLLESTSLSVSSIAQNSGYSSEIHMIRHFNKYTGTSPSRFRRQRRP